MFYCYVLKPFNYTGPTQIGFVISNKVTKLATKRNRAKRLLREAVRLNIDKYPENRWIVYYLGPAVLKADYEKVASSINKNIQEISVAG